MNAAEKKMVEILTDLRENHQVQGIKTEFEGEGIRIEDLIRQKEISMLAGLPITVKIGGGEAMTDMTLAKTIGVGKIVAPMMESSFAVTKFLEAAQKVYEPDELSDIKLGINIETISAYNCYKEILANPNFDKLYGISIGRKDLAFSMGMDRKGMDGSQVTDTCRSIMEMTKKAHPHVKCIVGGISSGRDSIELLRTAYGSLLDAYETRKVIFSAQELNADPVAALRKALEFEILYYSNKKAHYTSIATLDDAYLERLQKNYNALI